MWRFVNAWEYVVFHVKQECGPHANAVWFLRSRLMSSSSLYHFSMMISYRVPLSTFFLPL